MDFPADFTDFPLAGSIGVDFEQAYMILSIIFIILLCTATILPPYKFFIIASCADDQQEDRFGPVIWFLLSTTGLLTSLSSVILRLLGHYFIRIANYFDDCTDSIFDPDVQSRQRLRESREASSADRIRHLKQQAEKGERLAREKEVHLDNLKDEYQTLLNNSNTEIEHLQQIFRDSEAKQSDLTMQLE